MRKDSVFIPGLGTLIYKKVLDLGHHCAKCKEDIRPGKPGRLCKSCRSEGVPEGEGLRVEASETDQHS